MKKVLTKIIGGALALCLLLSGLIGCGAASSWKSGELKNGGAVISETNGGFMVETENYVYYINGVANTSENNAFGAPVKGTLMAVDKTD